MNTKKKQCFLPIPNIISISSKALSIDQYQQLARVNEILTRQKYHKNSHRYEGELRLIEMLLAEAEAPPRCRKTFEEKA